MAMLSFQLLLLLVIVMIFTWCRIKTRLVKNNSFLNIGKFNPVSIYFISNNCTAVDLKGEILYFPESYDYESSKYIEPKYLPNNEKAVDIACPSDF